MVNFRLSAFLSTVPSCDLRSIFYQLLYSCVFITSHFPVSLLSSLLAAASQPTKHALHFTFKPLELFFRQPSSSPRLCSLFLQSSLFSHPCFVDSPPSTVLNPPLSQQKVQLSPKLSKLMWMPKPSCSLSTLPAPLRCHACQPNTRKHQVPAHFQMVLQNTGIRERKATTGKFSQLMRDVGWLSVGWLGPILFFQLFCSFERFQLKKLGKGACRI